MKKDPYKSKERFDGWLTSIEGKDRINELNKSNSKLIISFIKDMRIGINISNSSKKGERSFSRLNHLRQKLVFIIGKLEERNIKDVRKATDKELHKLFSDMRVGTIKTRFGTSYKSTGDYVKIFKTFWHWHQKVEKNKGKVLQDITSDLDTRGEKPKFVYFTQKEFEKILEKASHDLKPIIALAFDSGMRVTELINTKVSDFSPDFKELNIRDEVSKTFGRKIKIMMCSEQIKNYVSQLNLKEDDYICKKEPPMINKELRKLGKELLPSQKIKFKNLTLYDFRHSSACFWLPRYKQESVLKYRFGWKKSEMIHYYTEFMGMKDTITNDDLYVGVTKTELEKEVIQLKNELSALKDSVKSLVNVAHQI